MSAAAKRIVGIIAKSLRNVGQNSEEKKGNKILVAIVTVIFFVIFLIVSAISLPSLLLKGFDSKEDAATVDFNNIQNSKIYAKVKDVYLDYNADLDKTIADHIAKMEEENTYTETVTETNPETGEKVQKEVEVKPEIIKNVNLEKPKIQYAFAYISTKYVEFQTNNDEFKFNKKDIHDFFSDVTTLHESTKGKDPIYYDAYTVILDENEIAKRYFPDSIEQQEMYLISYESYMDIIDDEIQESYENIDLDTLIIHENGMQIPHYLQYDSKWGKERYGSGTLSQTACGPTSFAMVASYLNNEFVSPLTVAHWSETNGYYIWGAGTSWGFYSGAGSHWNIKSTNLGKNANQLTKALSEGRPVIASMGKGTFTKSGHFIVLRGITADGKILVNDPNDNFSTKNFYDREFNLSLILKEAKNFWSFSK